MTLLAGMKFKILEERAQRAPLFSRRAIDKPSDAFEDRYIQRELRKETSDQIDPGFQPKKKKPTKNNGIKKRKKSLARELLEGHHSEKQVTWGDGTAMHDSSSEEEEEKEIVWEGPDIGKPMEVLNLDDVIKTVKQDNVVFDHGDTRKGRASDANFFHWLEEYSRLQYKAQKGSDDNFL